MGFVVFVELFDFCNPRRAEIIQPDVPRAAEGKVKQGVQPVEQWGPILVLKDPLSFII